MENKILIKMMKTMKTKIAMINKMKKMMLSNKKKMIKEKLMLEINNK